jgi:NAD+ synthase
MLAPHVESNRDGRRGRGGFSIQRSVASPQYNPKMKRPEQIAAWMRAQVAAAGARGLVVGLSGGVDSAVVTRLAQLAAPGAALAVLLPCHSDPQDERDAALVVERFSVPTVRIDLSSSYDALVPAVQGALRALAPQMRGEAPADPLRGRVPLANMKPRLRMAALYFLANNLGYLVAGTGNRAELAIGYFTKYGDGAADLLPLGCLVKSEVRELARELDVPAAVIERPPSAGLWLGQLDEEEMGFTYAELERYLDGGPEAVPPALAMRIERLVRSTEHKRAMPAMPEAWSLEPGG